MGEQSDNRQKERARLRARIEQSARLPALPTVVVRLMEMMESEKTTARQLGLEIARDQVLSAKVLKLVNSGFYGFSQPITTIPHAVAMLGFEAVRSLVMSSSVLELMDQALPGLWQHSLACARTSAMIAEQAGLPDVEELSVIGLLHDLGKVILCQTLPREFTLVQRRIEKLDLLFYRAEEEVLSCHHGEVAGWLLERWALPAKLVAPIVDHHDFRARRDHAERTAAVHLADILVRAESLGSGGDGGIPKLEPTALEVLGMNLEAVRATMDRMDAELSELRRR
ncbi:MAG: HDOD domain-containing protein [Gemmatimonadota bacterium]